MYVCMCECVCVHMCVHTCACAYACVCVSVSVDYSGIDVYMNYVVNMTSCAHALECWHSSNVEPTNVYLQCVAKGIFSMLARTHFYTLPPASHHTTPACNHSILNKVG